MVNKAHENDEFMSKGEHLMSKAGSTVSHTQAYADAQTQLASLEANEKVDVSAMLSLSQSLLGELSANASAEDTSGVVGDGKGIMGILQNMCASSYSLEPCGVYPVCCKSS